MTRPLQIYLTVSCLVVLGFARANGQNAKTGRYYYIGAVGNQPAQMDVTFDGHHLNGDLFYTNGGSPMKVSGSVQKNGHVEINVKGSERIHGKMHGTATRDHAEINGKWEPGNSNKDQLFHFIKVAEYLKSSIQQGTLISLTALYPYFIFKNQTGEMINSKLQDSVLDRQRNFLQDGQELNSGNPKGTAGWQQKINYQITYFSPDLISISGNIYIYTGGAHGMSNPLTNNFYITNGHVDLLRLGDLFKPDAAYEEYLSRICLKDLYKKGATWVKNGNVNHLAGPDLHHFTISPRGLTFYFPPYIVGPYSDGTFIVNIPFDSLQNYLNKNGPLQDLLSVPRD